MKPKDLKRPFSWEEREVLVRDRVWFVPSYYDQYNLFDFPGWDHPTLFGNKNPVCVEYCSGNGAWITEKAVSNSNCNWVAVEKQFKRARKIWSKVKNLQLDNLLVVCGEGHTVTSHYFPELSIKNIYINFPDPWPKDRHAKHRIIKKPFVEELKRILKADGTLTVVTDDPDYSIEMVDVFKQQEGIESLHPDPFYITNLEGYGSSFFDQLWREKGKTIHYHQYQKGVVTV